MNTLLPFFLVGGFCSILGILLTAIGYSAWKLFSQKSIQKRMIWFFIFVISIWAFSTFFEILVSLKRLVS